MRSFAAISTSILFSIAAAVPAVAEGAPDLSPLNCAWTKLPTAEQTRLRDEFEVKLTDGSFTIFFGTPNAATAAETARECQLNLTPQQIDNLAVALSRRAAVEKAKAGIAAKGEKPESIQTALAKMHEGKREVIGNRLSCPGPHNMVTEWDESVKGAIRRANLRFNDGRAYSWVSLGLYASMAEEGAMRRMNGGAEACS